MATAETQQAPLRTYRGNCHCGAFVYEVDLPEIKSVIECNCSIFYKKGYLYLFPGEDSFKVRALQGVNTWELEKQAFDGAALALADEYVAPEYKGELPAALDGGKLYTGGCHCGAVGVALMSKPLDETFDGLTVECNCSICERNGYRWIYSKKDHVVLAGDEANIGRYRFGSGIMDKTFCKVCGVCLTNELKLSRDEGGKMDEWAKTDTPVSLRVSAEGGKLDEWAKTHHPVNLRVFAEVDLCKMKPPEMFDGANKIPPPYRNP